MIYNPKVVVPPKKTQIEITTTSAPIILFHQISDIDRFTDDYVGNMYGKKYSEHEYTTILFNSEPGIYTVTKKYEIRNLAGGTDILYVRTYDTARQYKKDTVYIAWGIWGASDVREL